MRIKKSSIILIVCILTIICFCDFIKNTIATDEVQDNVLKTSTNGTYKWYSTLSSAVNEAIDGDVIEVYNSFTETSSVEIKKQNLTIKAANGYNPVISWTNTTEITVSTYTKYQCIVVYTSVTTSTTLGGGTGTLTFDASLASDNDNKGKRARVLAHCGTGKLNILDGVIFQGGKPGGGNYDDSKDNVGEHEVAEVTGSTGNGAGILMYNGTLNMSGGIVQHNYSLWGASGTHNLVGAGGGICIGNGATLNLSGGTIKLNAAGSGGGGGILVDTGGTLNITGGTVSQNNCNFSSGGGIAVNKGYAGIVIKGGEISNNNTTGLGGGIFARGDGDPLQILGGKITGNTASNGGGVLFWTVGSGTNKLIISGTAEITNNTATENGGGISIGRENQNTGIKCYLEVQDSAIISNNTATNNGGGIYLQPDNTSDIVNTVLISGGTISNNSAINGAGMYIPGGQVTVTGGTMSNNTANDGGAIYINKGDLLMTSGNITSNKAENAGGAVFANGGDIIIGIEGCTDSNSKHESSKTHPNVSENVAIFGGGGFMTDGTITMYCGKLKSNSSNNEGTGNNIYMNGGTFQLEGGEIGEETNPGIVLVGGQLNDTREDDQVQGEEVTMVYHSCLENTADHKTSITLGKYINLPAAQTGWVKDGYTMVGWTTIENAEVKNFEDYKSVGMAVKVENIDVNKQLHYYAVWAKTTSSITYELDGGTVDGTNVESYNYIVISKNIHLISPKKQDYTFIGWRLTASKDSITNWETYYPENENSVFYEVANPDSGLDLNIGTHFGDITLTAIYKANASDIEIVVKNENAKNQNYIFEITGTPNIDSEFTTIKVVVKCDENGYGSTTIKEIPVGTYTVYLQNDWTWRYELSEENINNMINIDIDESQDKYILNFKELSIKNSFWLNAYNLFVKNSN